MRDDLLDLAQTLRRAHRPYVVATVVWSRAPSSGKAGGAAIIEAGGTVHGWIGGACAEPAVIREARRVIRDGAPRLLYLGPADELDGARRVGVVTVPISCASEGALEVFMEPVVPRPHAVLVGHSPGVRKLRELLDVMDWRTTVVDDTADAPVWPADVEVVAGLDAWRAASRDDVAAVVVATQGHYDEPALEAALETGAPYVGLVASATRAATVMGYLRDRGYSDEALARIDTPAGLDLGHVEHREIAVAILAELVRRRAAGLLGIPATDADASTEPATAVDPVCGMDVDVATAKFFSDVTGDRTYFCCPACKARFEQEPAAYV